MIQRALDKTIVVKGNMRMYKALRNQIDTLNNNLCKYMESGISMESEELEMMKYIVELLNGISKEEAKEI